MSVAPIKLADAASVQPAIVRGRVPSVAIYEVTESELDALEQGLPSGLFLNFAIFFWSIAVSFFTTLMTADFKPGKLYTVFTLIVLVSIASAFVLTILWWRTHISTRGVIDKIRKRIPE